MPREPMVTRTIQTTNATILCVNTSDGSTFVENVTLPRLYKDDAHILKAAEKFINNETVKAVHVQNVTITNTRYGMKESKFIENGDILPPLGKPSDAEPEY